MSSVAVLALHRLTQVPPVVVPAKAGTQEKNLDSRFRGNDDFWTQSVGKLEKHCRMLYGREDTYQKTH